MGAFEFVALDKKGKESKGLLEGDTAKHVRQMLRERQLLPVAVTAEDIETLLGNGFLPTELGCGVVDYGEVEVCVASLVLDLQQQVALLRKA